VYFDKKVLVLLSGIIVVLAVITGLYSGGVLGSSASQPNSPIQEGLAEAALGCQPNYAINLNTGKLDIASYAFPVLDWDDASFATMVLNNNYGSIDKQYAQGAARHFNLTNDYFTSAKDLDKTWQTLYNTWTKQNNTTVNNLLNGAPTIGAASKGDDASESEMTRMCKNVIFKTSQLAKAAGMRINDWLAKESNLVNSGE